MTYRIFYVECLCTKILFYFKIKLIAALFCHFVWQIYWRFLDLNLGFGYIHYLKSCSLPKRKFLVPNSFENLLSRSSLLIWEDILRTIASGDFFLRELTQTRPWLQESRRRMNFMCSTKPKRCFSLECNCYLHNPCSRLVLVTKRNIPLVKLHACFHNSKCWAS